MYENIQDWKNETSTKKKEEHLLKFLEANNMDDNENREIVDCNLFDEDNMPYGNVDVDELFDALAINEDDFEDFLRSL